ncbi:Short-chain dehydrogenase TIC 32 [Hibiscus syriacus]|uniref:Short-chain dehydrogenase TIC 32 n=1 Tax=Hibiscus syriacus TaxID=106335 RepID=A0A6A3CML7_HIBSY|nr:Short-chain dehydrogenase TIC 32 [Hibiscus syriacus]
MLHHFPEFLSLHQTRSRRNPRKTGLKAWFLISAEPVKMKMEVKEDETSIKRRSRKMKREKMKREIPEKTTVRLAGEKEATGSLDFSRIEKGFGLLCSMICCLDLDFIGASSVIGAETARVHVVMGVRNVAAGKDVKEAIVKEISTAKVDAMELDLSSMESVRKFASDFSSSGRPLNLLMNYGNSFHAFKGQHRTTVCNQPHSGHFLLTHLLLDTMKKTARARKREGRIINVSSEAHRYTYKEGILFDKINDQSGYSSFAAYGQSKLANVLHANELARRLKEDGADITANSLHPGTIATNLFRHINLGPVTGPC